jgi:hypothetical protein
MTTFKELSKNENLSKDYREIYRIISETYDENQGVRDSEKAHKFSDIEFIRNKQYEIVKTNLIQEGIEDSYYELSELKEKSKLDVKKLIIQMKDGYYNDYTGIGTGLDPNSYSTSYIPISISPYEASAIYSSGGLAKNIIDKKTKGVLLNDYEFEGLEPDDAKELKEYAQKKDFERHIPLRDALVFGGSVLYPKFKKDNPFSYDYNLEELMRQRILDKDCIDYWISIDRWNCVHVPNYNITARDYLNPEFIYVPLGAQKVNTQRACLMKPYALPYWAAIQQLGWSTSDYIGYIKAIYDYEIMLSSLPIMFQQQSIMFTTLNLDAAMVMSGPDAVEEIVQANQERLRKANLLKPEAFNSASTAGDIKVIERNFSGFKEILGAMTQAISAKSCIPETVLFQLQSSGFSNNKEDILLKQSEVITMLANDTAPQLRNIIKILTISCFGANSLQAQKEVSIKFGSPVVSTDTEKSDIGVKLSQFISTCIASGISIDIAIKLSKQFYTYEIDDEDMARLEATPEMAQGDQGNSDLTGQIEGIIGE